MKYIIVVDKYAEELSRKVNEKIRQGFVPQGGVAVSVVGESLTQASSINLAQAMIYGKETIKGLE